MNHLLGVKNSDDLRKAHQTVQPQVVEMMTQVGEWVGKIGRAWLGQTTGFVCIPASLTRAWGIAHVMQLE